MSDFSGSLDRAVEVGELVDERYHLTEHLGQGGMGAVFRATDLERDIDVALKILHFEDAEDGSALARFEREAQMVARVDAQGGIVRVHALGQHRGLPYFVMQLVEGRDLHRAFRDDPPDPQRLAEIVEDVARTLHGCHLAGVVHRDLKPANILLRAEDGRPLVADFGLARGAGALRLTHTGALLGTPDYMAPEQARDAARATQPAVDIYQLGAILYRGLAGRPPHQAATLPALLVALAEDEPEPLSQLREGLPADLETICLRALAKQPTDRYPTALALAEDLARFRRGDPLGSRPSVSAVVFIRRRLERRDPLALGALAVLLLAVVAGGAGLWLSASSPARRSRATLADALRYDAQVVRPHALGLGEGTAPPLADVSQARQRLLDAEAHLDDDARVEAQELLGRLDALHAVLADVTPARGDGPWRVVAQALHLRRSGNPEGALVALVDVSEADFPGVTVRRRGLALEVARANLARAPSASWVEAPAWLAAAVRCLEPAQLKRLRRESLEAHADAWAREAEACRTADAVRALFARLRLVAEGAGSGEALADRLDSVLEKVAEQMPQRPGERALSRLYALMAQSFRLDPKPPMPRSCALLVKTQVIGVGDPRSIVEVLRVPVLELERSQVAKTVSQELVEELLAARPWSRAVRYVIAARRVEALEALEALENDAAVEAARPAVLAALREVLRPGDDLLDDLSQTYWLRTHQDLAHQLILAGEAVSAPADAEVWSEAQSHIPRSRELCVGYLVRELKDTAALAGELAANLDGWRASVAAREDCLREMEAKIEAQEARGGRVEQKAYRELLQGYLIASRVAFEHWQDDEEGQEAELALALRLGERGLLYAERVHDAARRFFLRAHVARLHLENREDQKALDVLEPALPFGLVHESIGVFAVRAMRRLGQRQRAEETLRLALKKLPDSKNLQGLRL